MNFVTKLLILLLVVLILSFVLPTVSIKGIDSVLTAATFLFSVIFGFEISMVISNFFALKTQLAIENAGLVTVYHLADIIGGDTFKKVSDKLEKYLLRLIDIPLIDHLKTDKEFFEIFEPIKELDDVEGAQRGQALQYMNEAIYYIPQARNQVADAAPRFIDLSVWIMLIFLALVLVFVLFVGRSGELFSTITTAIFSTTIIGSLMLLDEIDSNQIKEAYLEYEMFNDTLESMGKTRYYPQFAIKKGLINPKKLKKPYRIGVFPKYPSLEERKIKIVN